MNQSVRSSWWWRLGALAGALGVLCGAFGAHGLRQRVDAAALANWETAARYQLVHALLLLLVARVIDEEATPSARWSARLLVIGMLLFCGSLYALALGAPRWFGAIAPLGGSALVCAWIALAVHGGLAIRAR